MGFIQSEIELVDDLPYRPLEFEQITPKKIPPGKLAWRKVGQQLAYVSGSICTLML